MDATPEVTRSNRVEQGKIKPEDSPEANKAEHIYIPASSETISFHGGETRKVTEIAINNALKASDAAYVKKISNFHYACARGDIALVKKLLKDVYIETSNTSEQTAFHMAAVNKHWQVCDILIEHGANIDHVDNQGFTALALVAQHLGKDQMVNYLIQKGANIHVEDKSGRTAFYMAAITQRYQVCDILIKHGANIDHVDNQGLTALAIVTDRGEEQMVNYLIQKGANIHVVDKDGHTDLDIAIKKGKYQIATKLRYSNANISSNQKDECHKKPLSLKRKIPENSAITPKKSSLAKKEISNIKDGIETINLYKQNTINSNHVTNALETVNNITIEKDENINSINTFKGLEKFLQSIIQKSIQNPAYSSDPYLYIDDACRKGNLLIIKQLLQQEGFDFNTIFHLGCTLLMIASECGKSEIVKLLICKGKVAININFINECRFTALMFACKAGHFEIVKLLLDAGGNTEIHCVSLFKETALLLAVRHKHYSIANLLIDNGAEYSDLLTEFKPDICDVEQRNVIYRVKKIENYRPKAAVEPLTPDVIKKQLIMKEASNKNFLAMGSKSAPAISSKSNSVTKSCYVIDPEALGINSDAEGRLFYINDTKLYEYLSSKYTNNEKLLDQNDYKNIDKNNFWTIGFLRDLYKKFNGLKENSIKLTLTSKGELMVNLTFTNESTKTFEYNIEATSDSHAYIEGKVSMLFREIMTDVLIAAIHFRFPGSADETTNLFLMRNLYKGNTRITFNYTTSVGFGGPLDSSGELAWGLEYIFNPYLGIIYWDNFEKELKKQLSLLFESDDEPDNKPINVLQLLISSKQDQQNGIEIEEPKGKEKFLW